MRIYVFAEHYPNPYKPWIDTQLVELLRAGHDIRVLAEASYTSTINEEVRAHGLLERTSHYPSTVRTLTTHAGRLAGAALTALPRRIGQAGRVWHGGVSPKLNALAVARAWLMPDEAPDVCYIHNLVTASRLTFLKDIYPSARVCLYFHGGEVGGQPKVRGEGPVFAAADAVITGTRFAAKQAVERGCDGAKIAIAPLGFNLADYVPDEPRSYRRDGRTHFVSVARLSPEKGFPVALEAVRKVLATGERRFVYRIVGSGIERARLHQFVIDHQLGDVVSFAGEKSRAEVTDELRAADALILPSIVTETWAETQAAVVQEALLMKCLTLVTRAGGVPESNAPEMDAFAVPPADADALADAMLRVIRLSEPEVVALGEAGRRFAAEKYDIRPLMRRIVDHAGGRLPADDPHWFVARA
jgi:glycosyltransferase involved in cell wall biosynthesis